MTGQPRPPTPDGVPLLRNGLAFSRDPFGAMTEWAEVGDVVRLRFPGQSLYMVTDPTLVERVLMEGESAFTVGRQQRETFRDVEDHAVTSNTGNRWKRLRKSLQPAFTWDGLRGYGTRMAERTAAHVGRWETGERVDLPDEMRLLTLRILGDTLLGVDVEGDERLVRDAADALVARADPRRFGQLLPDWVPTPTQRRFERTVGELDAYVAGALADHTPDGRDDASPGGGDDASPSERDVASVLLAARERGDLSNAEVRDNLTALLLAGHDTTAMALTYAWYELSRHPDVRESLVEESERVLGDELPDTDDLDALERTRNVVRETLRLYPPTWAVNREALEDVTLGGYEIPAGAQLMVPQWVLHRDDRFWEDPETFDPSRWERDADRPEYAYFPFSGGPRHCIGMRFARLELVVVLATMVGRVALDVSVAEPLTFAPTISLRPETDIAATVERR
ncbi:MULTISPECIES: cytochrome P450 [Halorussus]|uniref:cytochrome P450 n=1 Tax=Halorussus TaxID=1070314 RepID=UPI0020A0289F|nr:cytochrome P450 [Halorussus vallis]USZ76486.1 cytochrome P450 [Halorussus vallis]